jgi:glycosyltransferase involved in cell wall biosynthesis
VKIGLVYQDALADGGYPRDVRALATALQELGCDVTLFADDPTNLRVGGIPRDQRVLPLRSLLRSRVGLDLLHVFGLFLPRHTAVLTRHAAGTTPVVLSPLSHLQTPAVARNRARKHAFMAVLTPVLRRLDAVHVFSETEQASLARWRALRDSPTFIASLGIHDADVIAATDPPPPATIVFFGRNDVHQKGIDVTIRGFSRFYRENSSVEVSPRLVIAGRAHASSEARIREILRAENTGAAHVDLLGAVADEEKWRLLQTAAMLVFMSRFDGPPRPIREALAVGTPCLVSYESNMGELVEGFGAGRAAPLEASAVAGCLNEAFGSAGALESWQAGARRLRAELTWPNVARTYLAGYESIGVTSAQPTPLATSP